MSRRPHGRKSTLALWMLVALADVLLLSAAAGVLIMVLIVIGLAVAVGGLVLARRDAGVTESVSRRRA
jgi:apolipoprotein N-acyltransferase